MKDFLGRELNVGDKCIYIQNQRTGSSTIRKIMLKGTIIGFSPQKVRFREFGDLIYPCDVVKIENIINCKYCKYYQEIEDFTGYTDCVHPKGLDSVRGNDFCSYAKIKECSE